MAMQEPYLWVHSFWLEAFQWWKSNIDGVTTKAAAATQWPSTLRILIEEWRLCPNLSLFPESDPWWLPVSLSSGWILFGICWRCVAPFFLFSIFSVDVQDFSRASGGGWPGTNEDVLMALRRIAELKTEGLEDGEYGDFGRWQWIKTHGPMDFLMFFFLPKVLGFFGS